MNQLIKLHVGLFKYLRQEILKKKSLKQLVLFFKQIGTIYLKELLKLYKTLFLIFDPIYQRQKKEHEKYQKIKVDLNRCLKMLQYIDKKMEKTGINRQRRRQFWRDFFRDGQVRKDIFDELLKEINQIR
jgi:hypothetical protein